MIACKSDETSSKQVRSQATTVFSGKTMGTTYRVVHSDTVTKDLGGAIDSLLIVINESVSTYIPQSTISRINNDSLWEKSIVLDNGQYEDFLKYEMHIDSHFLINYITSDRIYRQTGGSFDPTVMPLVNYWGFGYTPKNAVNNVDSTRIESIMRYVGFDKWSDQIDIKNMQFIKPYDAKLDFSAIAKGYAVDRVSSLLEINGVHNYIVEIGGEVFCKGQKTKNKPWTIAISKPQINAKINDVQMAVELNGVGLASSGNYRNFHKVNGKIYGHEINPVTGFPEMNDLLGVSVIASECMSADAYATAFMVMGLKESMSLVEKLPDTEAVFFFAADGRNIESISSSGFSQYLKQG
jgi:thiamine biosynthesis lipoprotein